MATQRRLYVSPESFHEGAAWLTAEESHYAQKVLRLKVGAQVEVFDGAGHLAEAVLGATASGGKKATLQPLTLSVPVRIARPSRLIVGCALPKGDRADWLVEKLAELGVERVDWVVFHDSEKQGQMSARLERHARLARAALRQSKQAFELTLTEGKSLSQWLSETTDVLGPKWVGHPHGAQSLFRKENSGSPRGCAYLLIGPEAGLRSNELQQAVAAGYTPCTVSSHILRIETAALIGAACLLF